MSEKEVRVRITGDISDLLNKLERVKDAFNDIGKDDINSKGVNDFINDLQRAQDEIELIETSLDEVIGTTKKFDDNSFSDMADEFSDANRQVNDLSDSFKELNEAIGDIDTRAFENLNDSMQEIADLDKKDKPMVMAMSSFDNQRFENSHCCLSKLWSKYGEIKNDQIY